MTHEELMARLRANDDETTDRMNPIYQLGVEIVAQAADGQIDLNEVARWFMSHSGLDRTGEWVGFDKCAAEWEGPVPTRDR